MKVEAVTLREVRMPLKYFFETSFGRSEGRRVLLVTVKCDGVEGWAECVAGDGPFYFAGEHMSYITAWQEGAVQSAHYTVSQIAKRVGAKP